MSGVWDPLRPELDTEPPLDPPVPQASYVICSTARSGSGLLCRALASTGLGGVPAEYFNANQREPLTRRWGCGPSAVGYARELRARRTGPTGVCGVKLHWSQLDVLRDENDDALRDRSAREILDALFPDALFVRLLRMDLTAQAVSLWTAEQTNVWSERIGEPHQRQQRRVRYSYAGIRRCLAQITEGEAEWERALAGDIRRVDVTYEDLCSDHAREVRRVLAALLPAADEVEVPAADSRRQADATSQAMARRFTEERRRRRRLARGPARVLRHVLPRAR